MPHPSSNLSCCFRYALPLCLIGFAGIAYGMPGGDSADGAVLPSSRSSLSAETVAGGVAHAALDWAPVSNDKLDAVRGGFDLGGGLMVSLGIQQEAYINGNLVVSTNINIPNVANITSQQAAALASVLNTVNVVQNGPGNTFGAPASGQNSAAATGQGIAAAMGPDTAAATVIQNTLNNQAIRSLTTLNISVNTLDALRSMNLQNTLQAAQLLSPGH